LTIVLTITLLGKQMHRLKRWMLMFLIAFPPAGTATETPDASGAEFEIAKAETALRQANSQRALWTSAEDALRRAHRALQDGNPTMAIEQARIAQQQSELGMAQKDYPLFR
jgi:hypothetical protein